MKTFSLTLLTLLTLSLPAAAQQRYRYECEGGKTFEAEYLSEQVRLTLAGQEITLPQVRSASGTRYSDGQTALFTKGSDAFIEVDGIRTYSACLGKEANAASQSPNADQPVRGLW